jgi:hypothetical protein
MYLLSWLAPTYLSTSFYKKDEVFYQFASSYSPSKLLLTLLPLSTVQGGGEANQLESLYLPSNLFPQEGGGI